MGCSPSVTCIGKIHKRYIVLEPKPCDRYRKTPFVAYYDIMLYPIPTITLKYTALISIRVKGKMRLSVSESLGRLKRGRQCATNLSNGGFDYHRAPGQSGKFNEQILLRHCNHASYLIISDTVALDRRHDPHWDASNNPPNVLGEMPKICDGIRRQKLRYYQGSYSLITKGTGMKLVPY